jgi:hypothetical protein
MSTTRKHLGGTLPPNQELEEKMAAGRAATDEDLAAQRISFAVGNALNRENITTESVKRSTGSVRLRA